jgi:hypothetical protein
MKTKESASESLCSHLHLAAAKCTAQKKVDYLLQRRGLADALRYIEIDKSTQTLAIPSEV